MQPTWGCGPKVIYFWDFKPNWDRPYSYGISEVCWNIATLFTLFTGTVSPRLGVDMAYALIFPRNTGRFQFFIQGLYEFIWLGMGWLIVLWPGVCWQSIWKGVHVVHGYSWPSIGEHVATAIRWHSYVANPCTVHICTVIARVHAYRQT